MVGFAREIGKKVAVVLSGGILHTGWGVKKVFICSRKQGEGGGIGGGGMMHLLFYQSIPYEMLCCCCFFYRRRWFFLAKTKKKLLSCYSSIPSSLLPLLLVCSPRRRHRATRVQTAVRELLLVRGLEKTKQNKALSLNLWGKRRVIISGCSNVDQSVNSFFFCEN